MTGEEAKARLGRLARARAFGRHVGSDQLIQAGLDALIADVDSPSLPLLAGLARREEPEAPELFDHVLDELGLSFEPPTDPTAAKWAHAYWRAEEITDGSLDPVTGADLIWTEVAEASGAGGNSTALVGTPDQVAEAILDYYDAGVSNFLVRGFYPTEDTVTYGRDVVPLVKAGISEREARKVAAE